MAPLAPSGYAYDSALCQKFPSKSSTCITTQKYIWDLNQNAQRWIAKKSTKFYLKKNVQQN